MMEMMSKVIKRKGMKGREKTEIDENEKDEEGFKVGAQDKWCSAINSHFNVCVRFTEINWA